MQLSFDIDVRVNVFEANIRLLGGLLSAHLLAEDPSFGRVPGYQGDLLDLAYELGLRLLPAFLESPTGGPLIKWHWSCLHTCGHSARDCPCNAGCAEPIWCVYTTQ